MVLISVLYLVAIIGGIYSVWKLGRKEHYDESKLIDLSLLSFAVGIVFARVSFFFFPQSAGEVVRLQTMPNVWLSALGFFQLQTGVIYSIGLLGFYVTAIVLLIRWRWKLWPMLGFLSFGLTVGIVLKELLLWYWEGLTYRGIVLGGAVIILTMLFYFFTFSKDARLHLILNEIIERRKVRRNRKQEDVKEESQGENEKESEVDKD